MMAGEKEEIMYRDLVGDPERITAGGRVWWLQQFCHGDGTLKAVRLFDAEGEFVSEFASVDDALSCAAGAHKGKEG